MKTNERGRGEYDRGFYCVPHENGKGLYHVSWCDGVEAKPKSRQVG